jgi:hypothetical protein
MRSRTVFLTAVFVLGVGGFLTLSLGHGQDRPAPATAVPKPAPRQADPPARDLSKLSPLQRQMELSAQRGADWLFRANRSDGRFIPGYVPALRAELEGDHYLRQAGAAFALARAARFTARDAYAARARQAVLTLLLDTASDAQDPRQRHTTLPSAVVNRLGAAGLIVLAVSELPTPGEDLLEQAEQLCVFIARQQRTDGSLACADLGPDGRPGPEDPDGINHHPGIALYGLMRSQLHRPAPWKTDVVRKALGFYRAWWKAHPGMDLVPWHVAAYAEAYQRTREPAFAEAVFEMSDWLCELQYTRLDPRHPLWVGGFMGFADGRPAPTEPHVHTAYYAEGLAEACRAARLAQDLPRFRRYDTALRNAMQFLTTLQYTDANTTHFADWYKPCLLGGFHASHQDGNLRIDYTQHAVCALVQYLALGAE